MSEKYKHKYRIKTIRLQNWDYRKAGAYYVTICTKNREYYFGKIKKGKMILSEIGEIVKKYWNEIPKHFSFVKNDIFIIMPNHIHGIIIIENYNNNNVETPKLGVSTKWQSGSLGVIINQYKRICTINIRKINKNFAWQSRFYEHIIRNKKSFEKIADYIINNPLKWTEDEYYLQNGNTKKI